jgi:hypothetical protein
MSVILWFFTLDHRLMWLYYNYGCRPTYITLKCIRTVTAFRMRNAVTVLISLADASLLSFPVPTGIRPKGLMQ